MARRRRTWRAAAPLRRARRSCLICRSRLARRRRLCPEQNVDVDGDAPWPGRLTTAECGAASSAAGRLPFIAESHRDKSRLLYSLLSLGNLRCRRSEFDYFSIWPVLYSRAAFNWRRAVRAQCRRDFTAACNNRRPADDWRRRYMRRYTNDTPSRRQRHRRRQTWRPSGAAPTQNSSPRRPPASFVFSVLSSIWPAIKNKRLSIENGCLNLRNLAVIGRRSRPRRGR